MICPHCSRELADGIRVEFCPYCGGRLEEEPGAAEEREPTSEYDLSEEVPVFTAEPSEPEVEEEFYSAWEDRERLGLMAAWWETTKAVLFRPSRFFQRLQPMGKLGDALVFAIVWIVIGSVFQALYGLVLQGAQFAIMRALTGEQATSGNPLLEWMGVGGFMGFSAASGLVCGPIMGFVGLIISAGIYHLILRVLRGTGYPFEASLRALAYAQAYNFWQLIPLCGGYVALVYWLVLAIIGLKEVHRSRGAKAAAAVLLPIAACLLCFCLLIAGAVVAGIRFGDVLE